MSRQMYDNISKMIFSKSIDVDNIIIARARYARTLLECNVSGEASLLLKQHINYLNEELVSVLGICKVSLDDIETRIENENKIQAMKNIELLQSCYDKPMTCDESDSGSRKTKLIPLGADRNYKG